MGTTVNERRRVRRVVQPQRALCDPRYATGNMGAVSQSRHLPSRDLMTQKSSLRIRRARFATRGLCQRRFRCNYKRWVTQDDSEAK